MRADYVEQILRAAVRRFHDRDERLLDVRAHEVACAHRIAVYLEHLGADTFWDEAAEDADVDLEYNRIGLVPRDIKRRPDGEIVRPDILIHRRGDKTLSGCFAAIEVKAYGSDDAVADDFSSGMKTYLENELPYPVFFYVDLRRASLFAEITRVDRGHTKQRPDPK